eukprot:CFRG0641T1
MYAFCFTIPYGFLVLIGGLIGYFMAGSTQSLVAGCGSGLFLLLLGKLSVARFSTGKTQRPFTAVSLVVAMVLAAMMKMRWDMTGKYMPAGLVFHTSVVMSLFYVWTFTRSDIKVEKIESQKEQ